MKSCKRLFVIFLCLLTAPLWVSSQTSGDSVRLEKSFSKLFVEARVMLDPQGHLPFVDMPYDGTHEGYGIFASHIREGLGYYGGLSIMSSRPRSSRVQRYPSIMGGAVWRPTYKVGKIDVQLYGGVALSRKPGLDLGVRFAAGSMVGRKTFSWYSMTLGVCNQGDVTYYSFGFSAAFVGLKALAMGGLYAYSRAW